jgi:hypothetical protein
MTDSTSVWYKERVDGMQLIYFFNNYLSTNFEPAIFSNYMGEVKEEIDGGGSGMGVNTPEEQMLAAAVGAPQQMTMGGLPTGPKRIASNMTNNTCCSEGCCGLCCLRLGGKRRTKHTRAKATRKRRGKTRRHR